LPRVLFLPLTYRFCGANDGRAGGYRCENPEHHGDDI
jgi:hypothetical protein